MEKSERSQIKAAIDARGADVYAGFLLSHLRPDMVVLDCGCGKATIAIGLGDAVPSGRIVGVDIEEDSLADARRYSASIGRDNLTDITRMPCSWKECVTMFTEEMPWLKGRDLQLVMGRAVCDWLGWNLPD